MSQPKDNSSPNDEKCCGKCPGKSCKYNESKESVKSQDTSKSGRSFTEVVQTKTNAKVKYIVHGKGQDGLPDIELSTASDEKGEKTAASAAPTVNPSELADIAKLMEEHQRERAEQKKQKEKEKEQLNMTEGAKCSRSTSSESSQETIDTQRKKIEAMKAKDCCKDSGANGPSK